MKLNDDPTIARIREARHYISQEYSHDPQRVVDYYIKLQKKYQSILNYPSRRGAVDTDKLTGKMCL